LAFVRQSDPFWVDWSCFMAGMYKLQARLTDDNNKNDIDKK
jgi:hypothetical protein